MLYFTLVSVFDISQTDLIDPTTTRVTSARVDSTGEEPDDMADALTAYLATRAGPATTGSVEGVTGTPIPQHTGWSSRRVCPRQMSPQHRYTRQRTLSCTATSRSESTNNTSESREPKPNPSPMWSPAHSASTSAPPVSARSQTGPTCDAVPPETPLPESESCEPYEPQATV